MNIKKTPDRYKTYKNSFKSIIKDNVLKNKIQDAMIRTNNIITRTYMVLRLYLINEFDLNNDIFNNNNKDNEFYLENVIYFCGSIINKKFLEPGRFKNGKNKILLKT